mmetsp:Transcript_39245/g.45634  ORF Transcript_39245/g.45634 Transcript_39245/m.45634 type:complete len:264 (-) Transcript_39245:158-949(-)
MNQYNISAELFNGLQQTQTMNTVAVQNIQNYLKMLMLRTNIVQPEQLAPYSENLSLPTSLAVSPNAMDQKGQCLSDEIKCLESISVDTESPASVTKTAEIKPPKKSGRLWDLMSKKYSLKKTEPSKEKPISRHCSGESLTYKKLNAVKVPVVKNPVPMQKKKPTCGHPDREHYGKGLCGSCYLKTAREKKPWNCEHDILYALGLCHKCYMAKNRQVKKEQRDKRLAERFQSHEGEMGGETPDQSVDMKLEVEETMISNSKNEF